MIDLDGLSNHFFMTLKSGEASSNEKKRVMMKNEKKVSNKKIKI